MDIFLDTPNYIKDIMGVLSEAGYEAYLVGGCVRDLLIGVQPKDYDITTSAQPKHMLEIFCRVDFDWLVDVVPTGIQHGTISVIARVDGKNVSVEITTFRCDGEYLDARRPKEVTFCSTIVEDLKRRDFTINAMAYSPQTGIIDVFGGREDIELQIVRCVGNPDERFKEDGLRILRAARFAVVLDFTIDHRTFISARNDGYLLEKISKERIRDELTKILSASDPARGIILLKGLGILKTVIPPLEETIGYNQNSKYHRYDLFTHTLKTLETAASLAVMLPHRTRMIVKLAALLHDIGKIKVAAVDEVGQAHYYGHEDESARAAHEYLRKFRFDNKTADMAAKLVRLHMKILTDNRGINDRNARKLIAQFSEEENSPDIELVQALFILQIADTLSKGIYVEDRIEKIERFRNVVTQEILKNNPINEKDLAVNGLDLIRIGIERGKEIGIIKKHLLSVVIEDPSKNEKEYLLGLVKANIANRAVEGDKE